MIHKNAQNTHRQDKSSLLIVLKIGTSSLCNETTHLPLLANMSNLVELVLDLKSLGHRAIIVTSAATGTGLRYLNISEKPTSVPVKQAVAAVGQGRLMALYDELFGQYHQPVAQLLLTKNDLADRSQYLNAVACLTELLNMGVVPIVNENDTISTQGVRFGDNDTLAAIVAGMVKADYLFLMTDVDCLYTDNPRQNPDAKPILECNDVGELRDKVSVTTAGSALGTGGMSTKLIAADLATAAGVSTIITNGSKAKNILHIIKAEASSEPEYPLCTRFLAKDNPLIDRKWWILHGLHTAGTVYINRGAALAVVTKNLRSSLFAAGVIGVSGNFNTQQAVAIVMQVGDRQVNIGKGLVNYASIEINRIKTHKSSDIATILGYVDSDCVIHRDNLVRTATEEDLV